MSEPRPSPVSRRDVLALGVGALVVASVPLAVRRGRRALVRRRAPVMGTLAEVTVVADDRALAEAAIDDALASLSEVDARMSRHVAASEIGRANAEAARRPVAVSAATAAVLGASLAWARASGGAFDPCLGAAIEAWDVEHRREPLPAPEARRYAGRGLWRALDLTPSGAGAEVRFAEPDARLDLGGIAKGWGVDRAADALRRRGVRRGLVNVGGDLYALGDSEDGDPWVVGVQDPFDPSGVLATLRVRDAAVATSGDYLRFFTYGGRRYHHLLDPGTGEPWQGRHSLTIMAPDCLTADAAATAVYGLDDAAAARTLAAAAPAARIAHSA